jgi:hypothetical protein
MSKEKNNIRSYKDYNLKTGLKIIAQFFYIIAGFRDIKV